MKKITTLTLSILICLSIFAQEKAEETTSILFLGNSYTYYNNGLDQVLKEVANSMGDVIEVERNTPGGYTMEGHSTNTTSLGLIQSREWDYVVLQEQSQKPAFPEWQVAAETYPYAEILCDSIHNNSECSTPVFFMTWGYENGDASNCDGYPTIYKYEGMQCRLRESYCEMAELNNGFAAPVGMVWAYLRESNPEIDLYSSDGSHPSVNGTYVAACTFYTSIFHKSPLGAYYPDALDEPTATLIQNAAWNVVTDSLDDWHIDTTTLRVDFEQNLAIKNFEGYFQNYSENADSCLWEFGDGSSAWEYPYSGNNWDITIHDYNTIDYYDVCLTAYKGCESESICKNVHIVPSGIQNSDISTSGLYPNPVTDGVLYAPSMSGKKVELYSIEGKLVNQSVITNEKIVLENLNNGFYILVIEGMSYRINVVN